MQLNQMVRNKAMLWAAVATVTGLALGIVGRSIQRRRQRMPTMIILEAC